jgi:hypothetical protein
MVGISGIRPLSIAPATRARVVRNVLQDFVSTAPQAREPCSQSQMLAAYLNALGSLCRHILQRYMHHGNRHLLARPMSPHPKLNAALCRRTVKSIAHASEHGVARQRTLLPRRPLGLWPEVCPCSPSLAPSKHRLPLCSGPAQLSRAGRENMAMSWPCTERARAADCNARSP